MCFWCFGAQPYADLRPIDLDAPCRCAQAVEAALAHVTTPFLMLVQHDQLCALVPPLRSSGQPLVVDRADDQLMHGATASDHVHACACRPADFSAILTPPLC